MFFGDKIDFMEITIKSHQNIVRTIVEKYNNGESISIKKIIHTISIGYIHTIHKSFPALCTKKPTTVIQKDFFVVVQYCLFIHSLYRAGLITIDKSHKNEPCNDYSNKGDYEYFSFQEVCGDEKLGRFVCDNWSLSIIPTTDLIELVKDKFKTPEQKRFECQKYPTYLSIFVAIAIGVLSPIFTECISKKGEQENLERIETAIKEHKTVSIDSICVMPKDTFNVKVIQPKVMSAPNPTSLKQLPLKN